MSLTITQVLNGALLLSEGVFCLVAALCFFLGKNYEPRTRRWMIWMQLSAAVLLFGDANAYFVRGMPGSGDTGWCASAIFWCFLHWM